jgi:hypothetical protein
LTTTTDIGSALATAVIPTSASVAMRAVTPS